MTAAAKTSHIISELASKVTAFAARTAIGPERRTPVDGLIAVHSHRPTALEGALYEPSFCLILQGRKSVQLGELELEFAVQDAVIVSHDLPVLAKITEAQQSRPFVALALEIDLALVQALRGEIGEDTTASGPTRSLERGQADPPLIQAMARLFELVDQPQDAQVLAPLVRREIHYRLLKAPHGQTLRQLLEHRSHASQIARAIAVLRRSFAEPLSVNELAHAAGMSESSFHEHFKSLTATSPLQYQKSLRLLEARRLLAAGAHNVTETAFEVGYQSPNQFSREYSRHFGHSPRHDLSPV